MKALFCKTTSRKYLLVVISLFLIIPETDLFAKSGQGDEKPEGTSVNTHNIDPERNKANPELEKLADYFEKNGFEIRSLLEDPRFKIYDGISKRFINSAEKKMGGIDDYKRVIGFDAKKNKIEKFINNHIDQLKNAEETYGIPKYVIAAIIGIESDFGRNIGKYNPFNAYVSMYVEGYRDSFARDQLLELMKFTRRNGIDVFELKSSYAGAMSYAQFIPYSLNKWFVGADIFDMDNNIMSVGNYLAYFMERTGSIEKAVFRYNPSSLYTEAVLLLAGEAEEMFAGM